MANPDINAVLQQLSQLSAVVAGLTGQAPANASAAPSFVQAAQAARKGKGKAPAAQVKSAFVQLAPAPLVAEEHEAHGHAGYSVFRVTAKGERIPYKWISRRAFDAILSYEAARRAVKG